MSPSSTRPETTPGIDAGRALVLAALVLGALWFWSLPWLAPLRLLVVLVHETGHALATLALGGRVERVVIGTDESGQCLSSLPPGWLAQVAVYSAGYVGSALAGALQLVLAFRFRMHRAVLGLMGVWVAAMGLLTAGDLFTRVFCLGAAVVFGVLARVLRPAAARATVMGLAVFTGLYALFDLRDDLWNAQVRSASDAALLAARTHVPALVWAALWSLGSVAVLLVAGRFALGGPAARHASSSDAEPRESDALREIRSLAASGTPRRTPRP